MEWCGNNLVEKNRAGMEMNESNGDGCELERLNGDGCKLERSKGDERTGMVQDRVSPDRITLERR
ncbi:putative N6-adenine-specific methylase [Sesbania bispinosa]|nr:putative N6-adenine-specific methylase [Sesbania bispinosa]